MFNCHFNSNFFPLFLERLLGGVLTPAMGSLLIGTSFVIPHINNLYFLSLCRKYGVYTVIRWLFYCKCMLSGFMLFAGPNNLWLLCAFIARWVKARSHCSDNQNDNDNNEKRQSPLVEWACAYSAWSYSTNRMRCLCVVVVIVFGIAALGPGLTFIFVIFPSCKSSFLHTVQ